MNSKKKKSAVKQIRKKKGDREADLKRTKNEKTKINCLLRFFFFVCVLQVTADEEGKNGGSRSKSHCFQVLPRGGA